MALLIRIKYFSKIHRIEIHLLKTNNNNNTTSSMNPSFLQPKIFPPSENAENI